ncbi:MAG TPA: hypothetical protein VFM38_14150 [Candidatus Limnocylindrales bacterium]|nr:hypothetical protein [Candidatus Limnocylindrales bacterium]
MIGNVDIERELDRWLAPGDDVLPARVIDSAMARIGGMPQRRARSLPPRRTDPMTLLRLAAAAALLVLATAGLLLVSGRPRDAGPSASPLASPAAAASVAAATASPSATPGPTGTPIWTSPPLGDRYTSPTLGYSMPLPAGYVGVPATAGWDYYAPTEDSSPWLEHIQSPDNMITMTARSAKLARPMTTDEWLEAFLRSPNAPYSADDCKIVDWETIAIGNASGRYYHEPCGLLWAVVAQGDRGYVFTMSFNVYDTPYLSDPFVATFKEMLAATELTPATAKD